MTHHKPPEEGDVRIHKRIVLRKNWRGDKVVLREEIEFEQYRAGWWQAIPTVTQVME